MSTVGHLVKFDGGYVIGSVIKGLFPKKEKTYCNQWGQHEGVLGQKGTFDLNLLPHVLQINNFILLLSNPNDVVASAEREVTHWDQWRRHQWLLQMVMTTMIALVGSNFGDNLSRWRQWWYLHQLAFLVVSSVGSVVNTSFSGWWHWW